MPEEITLSQALTHASYHFQMTNKLLDKSSAAYRYHYEMGKKYFFIAANLVDLIKKPS